ncbi:MAG TPA: hypothetical protein VK212_09610 [Lentimicrobium sp.]|nr:hypothetical protein [Lentimicrobium sp.]
MEKELVKSSFFCGKVGLLFGAKMINNISSPGGRGQGQLYEENRLHIFNLFIQFIGIHTGVGSGKSVSHIPAPDGC